MVIHKYGKEDGKKGLEANWGTEYGSLRVKIFGANHWTDYLKCLFAYPMMRIPGTNMKIHTFWYHFAMGLAFDIVSKTTASERREVHIAAHSMGGPVGVELARCLECENTSLVTVNSPKPGNFAVTRWMALELNSTALYDRGDVVRLLPPRYADYPYPTPYVGKTKPFWKAHNRLPDWWENFLEDPYWEDMK